MVLSFKEKTLNESSLGRIFQHSKNSNIGIMTAHRGEFDAKENEKRNRELASLIRASKFGFIPVTGYYIENQGQENEQKVEEKSFLIISSKDDSGRLKGFIKKMGAKFNQDSVLYKNAEDPDAFLIGTVTGRWPGKDVEVRAGKFVPQKIGQFYTKMRNHRTFVFESVELPEGLMSRAYREKAQED